MLIAIFFLLIILAVVVYIAMQRRSVAPSAPAEQVVAPEDVVQPDADAMPEESQSDEVADIQKDLDATAVNEEDTGYTEVNTDLNSL